MGIRGLSASTEYGWCHANANRITRVCAAWPSIHRSVLHYMCYLLGGGGECLGSFNYLRTYSFYREIN